MITDRKKSRFSNKMIITETIIKPKQNSDYFEFENIQYKRNMTPAEKNWINYQKKEKKRLKKKAKAEKKPINSDTILKIMFGILAIVMILQNVIQ